MRLAPDRLCDARNAGNRQHGMRRRIARPIQSNGIGIRVVSRRRRSTASSVQSRLPALAEEKQDVCEMTSYAGTSCGSKSGMRSELELGQQERNLKVQGELLGLSRKLSIDHPFAG